jgi:hypothetical protein
MTVGSGPPYSMWWTDCVLDGWSLRTHQGLLPGFPPSSIDWPNSVTWDEVGFLPLPPLVPVTDENGGSALPTWCPNPEPLTAETAWAAGLFEGEGYFWQPTVSRADQKPRAGAGLGMTDRDAVERFCRSVGMGKVTGPWPQLGRGTKPTWRWTLYGIEKVSHLASMLWDGLCARRRARITEILTMAMGSRNQLDRLPLLPTPLTGYTSSSPEEYMMRKERASHGATVPTDLQVVVTCLLPTPMANQSGKTPESHLLAKNQADGSNRSSITDLQILLRDCLLSTPTARDAASPARFAPDGAPHSPKNGLGLTDWARASSPECQTAPKETTGLLLENMPLF